MVSHPALIGHGDRMLDELWRGGDHPMDGYLGIAHGWAGRLYASLRWCETRGVGLPAVARERLAWLAAQAVPIGRGLCWPVEVGGGHDVYEANWCHGSAGYTFLWTLAHRVLGDGSWLTLAEQAAWTVWDAPSPVTSLCCGAAGQAYALLAVHRAAGDRAWLARAAQVAGTSAANGALGNDALNPTSLYKGDTGLALLAAELATPDRAAMPLFEPVPS